MYSRCATSIFTYLKSETVLHTVANWTADQAEPDLCQGPFQLLCCCCDLVDFWSKMSSNLKVPDELKDKLNSKFWTTSAMKRIPPSTFGSSPKAREKPKIDDGYEVTRTSQEWLAVDKHNYMHGRVRIEAMLGKLEETPPPGHYTPKIDMQSKRETIAPMLTLSAKPADHYLEELEDLKTTRVQIQMLNMPLILEKKKKKKVKPYRITRGQFEDVNIDDMRNCELNNTTNANYHCTIAVL